jgi:hypothetical protein
MHKLDCTQTLFSKDGDMIIVGDSLRGEFVKLLAEQDDEGSVAHRVNGYLGQADSLAHCGEVSRCNAGSLVQVWPMVLSRGQYSFSNGDSDYLQGSPNGATEFQTDQS